jgi:septal ring factor EnvC (AmiA/AmiB activator)
MRTVAEFAAMVPSLRNEERKRLETDVAEIEGKIAQSNSLRSALDKRLEEGWAELEKINRDHEALERAAHARRQELAGIDAANKREAAGAPGEAKGDIPNAGTSVQ